MAAKTPIRTVYDGSTATGLAEFQTGEFIDVEHGGTGNTSLTANSILLGNGTSAVASSTIQISSNTISSSDADTITIGDNLNVSGNIVATGNITANGDITIGDSASDTVTITADVSSNLIPSADSTYTLGDGSNAWSEVYTDAITLGGTAITSTAAEINYLDGVTSNVQTQIDNISSSFTISSDQGTDDTFTTGETFNFSGGTGVTTTTSDNRVTFAIGQVVTTTSDVTFNTVTAGLTGNVTGNVTGDLTGTASLATNVTLNSNNTTDETVYLTFADGYSGTQGLETDVGLYYNPSSNLLTTTTVDANLTGNVTGNVTGDLTGDVTGDLTGNVTGTVSDVSNHDTDDISEGLTNLYYTDTRARAALSASGDASYNSSTGVISFSETYSTAAELLTAIKTVDGAGSGLDADTLDGFTSGEFLTTTSVAPTAFASTSSTAYNTSDYGNLTNDTGTAGFVNEPIRATAYQDLALPGTTVSVDWGDLS